MYHILYETTNNINGKKYIGIHTSDSLDDGYIGSGTGIKRAIEKYGKDNFTRTILNFYDSREELLKAEAAIVTKDVVHSDRYYNMILGGRTLIDSLVDMDDKEAFKAHQSRAGEAGARALRESMSENELKEWHRKGGKASINPGGYAMSEKGKTNIRNARKNSQKYLCPICKHKPLDGGNFNKHMNVVHNVKKEECYQWRAGAKVDN